MKQIENIGLEALSFEELVEVTGGRETESAWYHIAYHLTNFVMDVHSELSRIGSGFAAASKGSGPHPVGW